MLLTSLVVVATVTSKWLMAGKVLVAVGTGVLTVAQEIEKNKRGRSQNNV